MTKSVTPATGNPKDWFYHIWEESFFPEMQLIYASCQGELEIVDNARDLVAETFVKLREHMQRCMQKIVTNNEGRVHVDANSPSLDHTKTKYLDRHKLGACVAGAFLRKGVFLRTQIGEDGMWSERAFFANELLAFQCALNVVYSFLHTGVKNQRMAISQELFGELESRGFGLPPTQEEGVYELHVCRALRHSHIQRHCLPNLTSGHPRPPFDLFLLSTILYDIEFHNLKTPPNLIDTRPKG